MKCKENNKKRKQKPQILNEINMSDDINLSKIIYEKRKKQVVESVNKSERKVSGSESLPEFPPKKSKKSANEKSLMEYINN